jgi:hypothetical protein
MARSFASAIRFVLVLTGLVVPALCDIFLANQTDSNGAAIVLSDYVHAKFGPYEFPPLVDTPLWEIPRDCALHTHNVTVPGRFIAVWQRFGPHFEKFRIFLSF